MGCKRVKLGRAGTIVITDYQQEIVNKTGEYLRERGESRFGLILDHVKKATGRSINRYQLWQMLLIMACKQLVILDNRKKKHQEQWRQIIKPTKRLIN